MIRRRTFLRGVAGAGVVAAAGAWVATSEKRSARLIRMLLSDARRSIPPAKHTPNPATWSDKQITLAWLGHSTVLINFYGLRILTDPVLSPRCGVSVGLGTLGPKRYVAPALSVKDLPPVDVIVLSHAHYDHFDTPTLSHVARGAWIATAKETSDLLDAHSTSVNELAWNDRATYQGKLGELEVQAIQVKHWGERWPSNKIRGYNGYILRRGGKALLFGGDTAHTDAFGDTARAEGPYAAAIMPIGAYRPWIWNHCNPEQALEMANMARANYILPVHHQTFKLSDEPALEPIERLTVALKSEPQRLAWWEVGETFVCPVA